MEPELFIAISGIRVLGGKEGGDGNGYVINAVVVIRASKRGGGYRLEWTGNVRKVDIEPPPPPPRTSIGVLFSVVREKESVRTI